MEFADAMGYWNWTTIPMRHKRCQEGGIVKFNHNVLVRLYKKLLKEDISLTIERAGCKPITKGWKKGKHSKKPRGKLAEFVHVPKMAYDSDIGED